MVDLVWLDWVNKIDVLKLCSSFIISFLSWWIMVFVFPPLFLEIQWKVTSYYLAFDNWSSPLLPYSLVMLNESQRGKKKKRMSKCWKALKSLKHISVTKWLTFLVLIFSIWLLLYWTFLKEPVPLTYKKESSLMDVYTWWT